LEVILDTNILIEILKNNKQTIKEVEEYDIHHISVITAMELFYGAFNKTELNKLKKFVELFHIININEEISDLSKKLVFDYAKSHSLDIPDSLIAATAIINNINLLSYNKKDFKFINNLKLL
jgi:predicted nucleic acid-binding protein